MYLLWLLAVAIFCNIKHSRQQYTFLESFDVDKADEKNDSQIPLLSLLTSTQWKDQRKPDLGVNIKPLAEKVEFISENSNTTWKPPLSTRGRYIVDSNGERFKLKAGNWHGASGTYLGKGNINDPNNHHAGEQAFQTPLCLDRTPIADIVQSFLDLGITTIRLPFSNEMIHSEEVPPQSALRANSQFQGMTPLQIYDACIGELTKRGLAVILNNHTVKNLWCCGVDVNSRWNGAQSEEAWQDDWVFMIQRYRDNPWVVGAELYNEVRRDLLLDPSWGSGGSTDWWRASQLAGTRILREANPDILIIIEGINYVGIPTAYTTHYRPELQPVKGLSHTMPVLDKLVYSSHFYAYTGPNATGGVDLSSNDLLYRDLSVSVLENTMVELAFYVATLPSDVQKHYTNPVWISEFGSPGRNDFLNKNRWWWSNFTSLLIKHDIDYALWPLTGWQENGKGDLWALNAWDSNGNRLSILDPGDWRLSSYNALNDSMGKTGLVEEVSTWQMLYTALGSIQQSNRLSEEVKLEKEGHVVASCPDGLRLAGLSYEENPSGLCTDVYFGRDLWNAGVGSYEIISSQVNVDADWAKGYTKYQCSNDHHLIGFSFTTSLMKTAVCAQLSRNLSNGGMIGNRTIWFNKRNNLTDDRGSWYGSGATAGTCNDDELLIGFAFSTHDRGYPAAILCENYNSSATINSSINSGTVLRSLSPLHAAWALLFSSVVGFIANSC